MTKTIVAFISTAIVGITIGWIAFAFVKPQTQPTIKSPSPTSTIIAKPTLTPNPTQTASPSASASASAQFHPLKRFSITASSYRFSPNQIKVKLGDKVQINLTDTGGIHNISIPAFNAFSPQINDNQKTQIEFIVDEKGTFDMYCDVEDHQQKGMVGKLIVE